MIATLKKYFMFLFALSLVVLVFASFIDLPVSKVLYDQNNGFGIFFAAYGALPIVLILYFVSLVLFKNFQFVNHNGSKFVYAGLSLLFFLIGFILNWFFIVSYSTMNPVVHGIIGFIMFLIMAYLSQHYIFVNGDLKTINRVAFVLVVSVVAALLIVNIIKIPWGRPRMRLIVLSNDYGLFRNWWQFGTSLKKQMQLLGVASEEFKSFPSGHTANGALMLLLPALSLISTKLKGKEKILFMIGVVWSILVAFSRILVGAHFISDVTVSFIITLLIVYVAFLYLDQTIKK